MDFYNVHPDHAILLLFLFTIFPRLTMLFAMTTPFGLVAWLGWIFVPRVVVAVYATMFYWATNPDLVIAAWVIAVLGLLGNTATGINYSRNRD